MIHVKNLNDPLPEGESNHINQIDLDRIATIIFTSGSTHEPKAAVHSYGNHHYNAVASNKNIPLAPADRWLLSLPLYHVGGLGILFRSFMAGAAVVIPRNRKNLVEDIKRYDVTCVSLVSTQLNRMLNDHGNVQTLAKMKAILLGGGPIPSRLYREARKNKLPVYATYGLTESSSQVATSDRPLYEFGPLGSLDGYVGKANGLFGGRAVLFTDGAVELFGPFAMFAPPVVRHPGDAPVLVEVGQPDLRFVLFFLGLDPMIQKVQWRHYRQIHHL